MWKKALIHIIVLLILSVSLGACIGTVSVSAKVNEQIELGNKYLQEGKYEEAILAFQKVIEIEPKNVPARIGLGEAYIASGKLDKAETVLKEVLGIEPKNVEAIIKLSQVYIKNNNVSGAEDALNKAIEIDSKSPQVYIELANIYIRQNKLDYAKKLLEKGYELTGDENIKRLLEEIKAKVSNTKVQAAHNIQNEENSVGNYVVLNSGVKIYAVSKAQLDQSRYEHKGTVIENVKCGIGAEIKANQIPPNVFHVGLIWKDRPISNQDISNYINNPTKRAVWSSIKNKQIPDIFIDYSMKEGSYYVNVVFMDENINVIAVYQISEPLFVKAYY